MAGVGVGVVGVGWWGRECGVGVVGLGWWRGSGGVHTERGLFTYLAVTVAPFLRQVVIWLTQGTEGASGAYEAQLGLVGAPHAVDRVWALLDHLTRARESEVAASRSAGRGAFTRACEIL